MTTYYGYTNQWQRDHGNCWFTQVADRLNRAGVSCKPNTFTDSDSFRSKSAKHIDKQIAYSKKFERFSAKTVEEFKRLCDEKKSFAIIAWNGSDGCHIFVDNGKIYRNDGFYSKFEQVITESCVLDAVILDMGAYIDRLKSGGAAGQGYDPFVYAAARRYMELHPDYTFDDVIRLAADSYIIPIDAGPIEQELTFITKS